MISVYHWLIVLIPLLLLILLAGIAIWLIARSRANPVEPRPPANYTARITEGATGRPGDVRVP